MYELDVVLTSCGLFSFLNAVASQESDVILEVSEIWAAAQCAVIFELEQM